MTHVPVLLPATYFTAALVIALSARRRPNLAHALALAACACACALSAYGLSRVLDGGVWTYRLGGWSAPVGIELRLDALSGFLALVIGGVGLFVVLHARRALRGELPGKEGPFFAVAMLLLAGLTGIVQTGDFFNLYVFLEISSLSGYALLGAGGGRSALSAFRYLVPGTLGASLYLLGLAFVFASTGSLAMADLADVLARVRGDPAATTGLALMAGGIALKMALFPLHGWLPDAYTDASSSASSLVAPVGTKVAAYVLLRLCFFVLEPEHARAGIGLLPALAFLGALGALWGSVLAIAQDELKRMLAYSSVAQIGMIAMGIGLATPYGFVAAVLHVANHACMKACLFLVCGNLRARAGHSRLSALDGSVRRAMPWTMASFTVAALSMVGVPPTAGFFSKWYLVLGAVQRGEWLLLAALLASSLLTAAYFFRVLERVYLRPPGSGAAAEREAPPSMLVPTVGLAAGVLALGLGNAFLVSRVLAPMLPEGL